MNKKGRSDMSEEVKLENLQEEATPLLFKSAIQKCERMTGEKYRGPKRKQQPKMM
jgi:hypothetical protein